ncbi:DMT family transporter [Novosphingobium sp.]|uniref:DMT family transporter n=1 Tax=Novosphingobium sp. TaxID=1874826 RepID=UPI003B52F4A3
MSSPKAAARRPVDTRAALIMVVLCAVWGTQQAIVKLAAADMSPTLQMAFRSGVATLGVLILARARGELRWFSRATLVPGMAIGLFFGLEFACVGEALRYTSASHVTVYLYSAPILIAIGLGVMHRDERLHALQWLGVLFSFAGIAVTFLGRGQPVQYPSMHWGDALALTGAMSWALTAIVLRGSNLANAPATVTLAYQLIGAMVMAGTFAMIMGETAVRLTPGLAIALLWQVVVVAFASYLTWFALLRQYSSARLGVLSFMTPVFGVAGGVLLVGDHIDTGFGIGAAMILGGIIFATTARPLRVRQLA